MRQNEILFFLGSVVLIVFSWIAFTIVHNSLTSSISETIQQAIIAIQPTFDTKIIDSMRTKPVVSPAYTIQPQAATAIVVTSSPQPASASGQVIATSGGVLR